MRTSPRVVTGASRALLCVALLAAGVAGAREAGQCDFYVAVVSCEENTILCNQSPQFPFLCPS